MVPKFPDCEFAVGLNDFVNCDPFPPFPQFFTPSLKMVENICGVSCISDANFVIHNDECHKIGIRDACSTADIFNNF